MENIFKKRLVRAFGYLLAFTGGILVGQGFHLGLLPAVIGITIILFVD